MGKLAVTVKIEVLGKKGTPLVREFPMKSWTLNLFNVLYPTMYNGVGSVAATKDITNTNREISADFFYPNFFLAVGGGGMLAACPGSSNQFPPDYQPKSDNIGIVIGTGNTAVTPQDYALGTKIAHGGAASQMRYGGQEILAPTFSDPNGSMVLRRLFENASGGSITVNEVGIYAPAGYKVYTSDYHYYCYEFCVARDVVSPGIAIADTEWLKVTYTVQITV
jgi:hypothetical protein